MSDEDKLYGSGETNVDVTFRGNGKILFYNFRGPNIELSGVREIFQDEEKMGYVIDKLKEKYPKYTTGSLCNIPMDLRGLSLQSISAIIKVIDASKRISRRNRINTLILEINKMREIISNIRNDDGRFDSIIVNDRIYTDNNVDDDGNNDDIELSNNGDRNNKTDWINKVKSLTVPDLKKVCRKNHLATSGRKDELVERIINTSRIDINTLNRILNGAAPTEVCCVYVHCNIIHSIY